MGKIQEQIQHLQDLQYHPGWKILLNELTKVGTVALKKSKNSIQADQIGSCGFWMGYHDAIFNVMDIPILMIEDLQFNEKEQREEQEVDNE